MSFSKVIVFLLAIWICESIAININKDSYLNALDNSRIVNAHRRGEIFYSGLYNKGGNGGGADFGLTSDVYTKPNPYYTKNKTSEKKPEPIYYPAVNTVDNDSSSSSSSSYEAQSSTGYSYELPPTDYGGPSSTGSDSSYNSVENSYPLSDSTQSSTFGSTASTYGAPAPNYGAPAPHYGAPTPHYSAPASHYGAPAPHYGAPASHYPLQSYSSPHSSYGIPASYYPAPTMAMPMEMNAQKSSAGHWLIAKIFKKFDLILMSKILLKLIIFKKIVKFIGIICLLFFIPTLKKKFEGHDDSDEERSQYTQLDDYAQVDLRVKEIVNFALTAIEGFSYDQIPWCVGQGIFCRLQYMFDTIDLRYPGNRILTIWLPQLQTTTTQAPITTSTQRTNFDEGTVDFNEFITDRPNSSEEIGDHDAMNLQSNEI